MPKLTREVSLASSSGRVSVLDTLMLRPPTEHADYVSCDRGYPFGDEGCATPLISSDAASDSGVDSLVSTVISPHVNRETSTPTTRSEQLAILLARNYHSAPACSLDFISITSSIYLSHDEERDSERTLLGSPGEQVLRADVPSSLLCTGVAASPTSTLGDNDEYHSNDSIIDEDNVFLKSMSSSGQASTDAPSEADEGASVCALVEMHNASEAHKSMQEDDVVTSELPLGRMVHRHCVEMGTSPMCATGGPALSQALTTSATGGCGVDASTSPIDSAKKSIPVYSRNLLYRIRVPLAQRLRNACSNFSEENITPGSSTNDANKRSDSRSVSLSLSFRDLDSDDRKERTSLPPDSSPESGTVMETHDSPQADVTFRKKARLMSSVSSRKRPRLKSTSPHGGLVVAGELWRSGSMKYIGAGSGDTTMVEKHGSRSSMLKQLLLNHYYLCSAAKL
ncbi:uncharacterized protein BXIN_0944 [Babesia sp. Xinjiang]|uniref:uncharacterized protein n=1 Tax=Babesia sp. Xinjiang TaxID=462227 RepID=UPI000A24D2DC|nr:uncharacterized protein BXIN_0944 [Babesia sp. Xinjiang]ORM42089.1 hypothetical protein BXIN_0944 [Babesia sp. Xinjiang]